MECDDDRRLQPVGQQRPEAQLAHALDQHLAVLGIAPAAAGLAALGLELLERLVERHDHMDRRSEAVLPGLGEVLPLVVEIEHQGGGVALGLGQRRLAADDEAEAGHALDALVGGGGERVEPRPRGIERQGAERAHGIDQEPAPLLLHQRPDLRDRVQDAARRLAMHGEHVSYVRIRLQQPLHLAEVGRRILGRLVHGDPAPGDQADPLGALAIGAVDEQQHFSGARHEGGEHRLDGKRARALHRHRRMRAPGVDHLGQALQHLLVDPEERGVARAPVVDHRLLDRPGGGQRPRRQKQRIAGLGGSARRFWLGHGKSPTDGRQLAILKPTKARLSPPLYQISSIAAHPLRLG